MFTQQEYIWAWVMYLIGCAMCLGCFWLLTRRIPWPELRSVLRVSACIIALLPWSSGPEGEYLSPAWIVGALESIFDGPDAFWRAGTPLVIALVVGLLASGAFYGYQYYRAQKAAA